MLDISCLWPTVINIQIRFYLFIIFRHLISLFSCLRLLNILFLESVENSDNDNISMYIFSITNAADHLLYCGWLNLIFNVNWFSLIFQIKNKENMQLLLMLLWWVNWTEMITNQLFYLTLKDFLDYIIAWSRNIKVRTCPFHCITCAKTGWMCCIKDCHLPTDIETQVTLNFLLMKRLALWSIIMLFYRNKFINRN